MLFHPNPYRPLDALPSGPRGLTHSTELGSAGGAPLQPKVDGLYGRRLWRSPTSSEVGPAIRILPTSKGHYFVVLAGYRTRAPPGAFSFFWGRRACGTLRPTGSGMQRAGGSRSVRLGPGCARGSRTRDPSLDTALRKKEFLTAPSRQTKVNKYQRNAGFRPSDGGPTSPTVTQESLNAGPAPLTLTSIGLYCRGLCACIYIYTVYMPKPPVKAESLQ